MRSLALRTTTLTLGLIVALALILSASALAAPPLAPAAACTWTTAVATGMMLRIGLAVVALCPARTTRRPSMAVRWISQALSPVQNLILGGGILQGSADLTVTQVMTWTGGEHRAAVARRTFLWRDVDVTGYVLQRQRTLNNAGTLNWTAASNWYIGSATAPRTSGSPRPTRILRGRRRRGRDCARHGQGLTWACPTARAPLTAAWRSTTPTSRAPGSSSITTTPGASPA